MHRFTLRDVEQRVFDMAVIGGGVTGASAARETALRGLSVVLVEKGDFAAGTSSRSTKRDKLGHLLDGLGTTVGDQT
jgi:glycerol-3-phosphate dehydrogenase